MTTATKRHSGPVPCEMVDAEPARAHVRALNQAGISLRQVSKAADLHYSVLTALMYGRPCKGQRPSQKIRKTTADKILAVDAASISTPLVDAIGTRRRLQALVAIGWPGAELMRRLGCGTHIRYLLRRKKVTAATAAKVKDLYQKLKNQPPPAETWYQRSASTRACTMAAARKWPPPMAWDEGLLDLTEEELAAEVERQVALLDPEDLARCYTAVRAGERSPVIVAAAREHRRRRRTCTQAGSKAGEELMA